MRQVSNACIVRIVLAVSLISLGMFVPQASARDEPRPTRRFAVRDGRPMLDKQPVKLWGLRCNNALLSPAVTERLINNLDNMRDHGVNLVSVSLQGTNGGFPNVDAGPNAFTSDGKIIPAFARRLEDIVRQADQRGMVVCIVIGQPRKDQLLRDEAALKRAVQETAALLVRRKLQNVFVELFHEFNHPTRIDHDILREPNGDTKRCKIAGWWKEVAPSIPSGMCPNHNSGSPVGYPGCDILMFENEMPIPNSGFAVNVESSDRDQMGNEGVFNEHQLRMARQEWSRLLDKPSVGFLFRSPFVEDVTGAQGTGPNFEMGGMGTGESDRGIRPYYEWLRENVGRWEFPTHRRIAAKSQ